MKFEFARLVEEIQADWPVRVSVPQDGGAVQVQELSVRFRLVDQAKLTGLDDTRDQLRQVIVGFGKAETEPFTPELLELMLARPFVMRALNQAYGEFATGVAPEKNF